MNSLETRSVAEKKVFEETMIQNKEMFETKTQSMQKSVKDMQAELSKVMNVKNEVELELRGIMSTDRRDTDLKKWVGQLNEVTTFLEEASNSY